MDLKEEIKNSVKLSEVIGKNLSLKKRDNNNYVALCPFHKEKTPSFNISDDKGFYHCFGCGKNGDIFNYLMETENLSFIEALKKCMEKGIITGCITCNKKTPLAQYSKYPIEIIVGPEFVTGSTRMKAGTAQKLILNMISTSVMIKLDRVKGNKMVDMQLSNNKLVKRGTNMVMKELKVDEEKAKKILLKYKSVRAAIKNNE